MEQQGKLRFMPIGYKLMLSYCLLIVVPLVTVAIIISTIYVTSIREQTRNNVYGTVQQITDNITYKLDAAIHITELLYHDTKLARILRQQHEGWEIHDAAANLLLPKLRDIIKSDTMPMMLSFYIHNASLPEVYSNRKKALPYRIVSSSFDLYQIERIAGTDWYHNYPEEDFGNTIVWGQIEDDREYHLLSLLRRVVDVQEFQELAFMRLTFNMDDIFRSVDSRKIGDGSTVFVVDQSGQMVFSSGDAVMSMPYLDNEAFDKGYLVIKESLPYLNWQLITLVPTVIIEKDVTQVRWVTIIVGLTCLVIFIIIGYFVSNFFSKRVGKIVAVLSAFREGDFHKRMNYRGNDEFALIAHALNDMGKDTEALIEEVYLSNIEKKEAELDSLQSQINPHFLYNTLSSISSLAKFGEIKKLNRMVIDLSTFYRLTLNNGKMVILLRDELAQAQAYINIQRTKYGDQMQVIYSIDPDVLKFETIKLILQPILENVFEHAWTEDGIRIRVVMGLEQEHIIIRIIDDGNGMHPGLIQQIFDPLDQLNVGIGIRNVDQRIKLHFGKGYGVSIFSRQGIGTSVTITLPAELPQKRNN